MLQRRPRGEMDIIFVFGTKGRGSSPLEGTKDMKIGNWKLEIGNLLIAVFLISLFLVLAPTQLQAALVPCGYDINGDGIYDPATEGCQLCHIFVLINNILIFLLIPNADINNNLPLIPTVATLMIIIGGFYLLIAGPNPEFFNQGKSILTATVIGLVICLGAWVFLSTFLDMIGVAEWTGLGNWWEIDCP